jgi:hypothetical protein
MTVERMMLIVIGIATSTIDFRILGNASEIELLNPAKEFTIGI